MSGIRIVFSLALVWAFLISSSTSFAIPLPDVAVTRCNVIHAYEGLCGNIRPQPCLGLPSVHYSDNPAQQTTWDNYVNLCVYTIPSLNRYSHECIEFYHLGSTCISTVPDLIENTAITGYTSTATLAATQNQNQIFGSYQTSAYYCGISIEGLAKVTAYKNACGDIVPGSCPGSAGLVSDYRAVCGEVQPCECLSSNHCGPACPILGPPPMMPGNSTGGGGGTGGAPPPSDGSAAGPASDSSHASGFGTRNSPEGTDSSAVAKTCSLNMRSMSHRPWDSLLTLILLFGILIPSRLAKSRESK